MPNMKIVTYLLCWNFFSSFHYLAFFFVLVLLLCVVCFTCSMSLNRHFLSLKQESLVSGKVFGFIKEVLTSIIFEEPAGSDS